MFVLQNFAQLQGMNTAAPGSWTYQGGEDTIAEIGAANYFSEIANRVQVGDPIYVVGDDANEIMVVTAVNLDVTPNTITTSAFAPTGSVGTANLVDLAVTTAKLADGAVTTAKLADGAVTSAKMAADMLRHATVQVNNAGLLALNGTSLVMVAAPGANLAILVDKYAVRHNYDTAAFTGSGNVGLQYGNTAALAGVAASATLAETGLFTASANTLAAAAGAASNVAVSAVANTALYLSASTALAVGGGTATVDIWYKVVPTNNV